MFERLAREGALCSELLPGTPPKLTSGGAVKNEKKFKVAASGAWKDERTFEMTWRYYETPHHDSVTCQFEGDDRVRVSLRSSMVKMSPNGKDKRPVLEGRMAYPRGERD